MTRILIADSDPRTRQALALLLERKLGIHSIGEAWDRASLERQLAASAPDLILLDCYLPGLSDTRDRSPARTFGRRATGSDERERR